MLIVHLLSTMSTTTPPNTSTEPEFRPTNKLLNVFVLLLPILIKNVYNYYTNWGQGTTIDMSHTPHIPHEQHQWQVVELKQPLQQVTVPVKQPGSDEVLVEIHASSVNPLDWKLQDYSLWGLQVPYPVGYDFAGKIVAVGSEVKDYAVHDKVVGRAQGSFGHYVNAKINSIVKFEHFTYHDAASLPVAYLSAYDGLYIQDDIRKRKGQTIFIPGAAGGVAHFAVQLALAEGLTVIGSTSKPDAEKYLKSIGVQHVINYKNVDVVQEVLKLTNNEGVDIVYDSTYLPSSFAQSASVIKKGAPFIQLGPTEHVDHTEAFKIAESRGGKGVTADLGKYARDSTWQSRTNELNQGLVYADKLYSEHKFKPYISKTYELHEVNEALNANRHGQLPGKIVIKIR